MSNIIQLLEKMGSDASLQNQQQLNNTINQADINVELKQALMAKDTDKLNRHIENYPETVCILIVKPDDAPDEQPEPEQTPEESKLIAHG
ncbi:MAG: hypothetical protein JKX78_08965 [Alteromonadaceae bacterium]|nr:hypothetical protein [Alteromonadaceae bacterium]